MYCICFTLFFIILSTVQLLNRGIQTEEICEPQREDLRDLLLLIVLKTNHAATLLRQLQHIFV
jgi:hypothetical protein